MATESNLIGELKKLKEGNKEALNKITYLQKEIKEKKKTVNKNQLLINELEKENKLYSKEEIKSKEVKMKELELMMLEIVERNLNANLLINLHKTEKLVDQMIHLEKGVAEKKENIIWYEEKRVLNDFCNFVSKYMNLFKLIQINYPYKLIHIYDLFIPTDENIRYYFIALKLILNELYFSNLYTNNINDDIINKCKECFVKFKKCCEKMALDKEIPHDEFIECFSEFSVYEYFK